MTIYRIDNATLGESHMAQTLLTLALRKGWRVIHKSEEGTFIALGEKKYLGLVPFLNATGEDIIHFANDPIGNIGWVQLIWGNEADGTCLIADHADNEEINRLVEAAQEDHEVWVSEIFNYP